MIDPLSQTRPDFRPKRSWAAMICHANPQQSRTGGALARRLQYMRTCYRAKGQPGYPEERSRRSRLRRGRGVPGYARVLSPNHDRYGQCWPSRSRQVARLGPEGVEGPPDADVLFVDRSSRTRPLSEPSVSPHGVRARGQPQPGVGVPWAALAGLAPIRARTGRREVDPWSRPSPGGSRGNLGPLWAASYPSTACASPASGRLPSR